MMMQQANKRGPGFGNSLTLGIHLKQWLLGVCLLVTGVMASERGWGQLSLTNASPAKTIDFSATISGVNNGAYTGSGFSSSPSTGQLNSNAWETTGWSDGNLAFGGTNTTGDYARGTTSSAVATGGYYAFTGSPHSTSNPCLMIQPGSSDWEPGILTLRIINNGTSNITQLTVSYNLFVRDDQGRSNSFNFSYSSDNTTYTSVNALDYSSTTTTNTSWVQIGGTPSRSTTISSLSITPGNYIYIRWSGSAVGGSGSRDEFGLDDISVTATFAATTFNVTYNGNINTGGSVPTDANNYIAAATVTVLGNTGSLSKTGYTFNNWNTQSNGGGTPYSPGNTFTISASTTLYAQWLGTVSYDGNGSTSGGVPTSSTYFPGATVTVASNTGSLARNGYTFNGWNSAANGSGTHYNTGTGTFTMSGNVTLYAEWTPNNYSVNYNGNTNDGGSVPASQSGNYNSSISLAGAGSLTKSGYAFAGWNTAADGSGTSYAAGASFTIPAGNTTLYAQWIVGTSYTVTYNGNGNSSGTAPNDIASPYLSGSNVTVLSNNGSLAKTGYSFTGWNTQSNGAGTSYSPAATFTIGANTTLYAVWTINNYTVTYDGNTSTSGSAPVNQNGNYNSSIVLSGANTLVKTGYTFNGWNTLANGTGTAYAAGASFTIPATNATLYAQWTINSYSVQYDGNANTGGTAPATQNANYNTSVTLSVAGSLVRTGYTFANWNSAADGTGINYATGASYTIPAANTTLYAKWTVNSYSVSYNGNGNTGGATPSNQNANYNTSITLSGQNTLTKTGYTFSGWNTLANGTGTAYAANGSFTIPASNTTLYAHWTINSYSVTYNGNGSTGGTLPTTQNANYNTSITISSAGTMVKTGYNFVNWNTAADGIGTNYSVGASYTIPAANTNMYAQWTCAITTPPVATSATSISNSSITANWNAVGGANGYYLDLYTLTSNSTIAGWSFPTSGTIVTPDTYSTNNSGQAVIVSGANSIGSSAGASTQSASTDGWDNGNGIKYWQISLNTTGFYSIYLSSKQRSSPTGPKDFKVQYKIGISGSWTDVGSATVTTADNFTAGLLSSILLPSTCNNQAEVYLRWIMTSNSAVGGGSVASTGTSRIDDILISGDAVTYVSGYQNTYSTTSPLELTGLSASTTYYYVVRATNGSCATSNSNAISATTAAPCVPTATISSFQPTTGPAYSLVTITGTGFTGATAVKFGATSAISFTVVNNTTITAEVPVNAPTEKISVTVGGCDAVSASSFTGIAASGCGTGGSYASDLFISEIFDSDKGSLSYIEIFNGTSAPVDLTSPQYTVRFITGTSTITDYPLTGTIPSGSVFVLRVGDPTISGSSVCSVTSGQTVDNGSGFNGNDRVYLLKSGNPIDYIPNPNYGGATFTGFSQVRNNSATGPTMSYTSSQWSTYDVEDCSTLGVAPYSLSNATISITTHPVDVNCNSITFSVAATSNPSPVGNYIWKYNDPATMTGWTNLSTINNTNGITISGLGTASITITGATAALQNYQFYCEVTKNSCSQASNAAQYSYSTKPYYKAVVTGKWTSASNWQMSDNGVSGWVAACNYPVASNSQEISIPAGITINHNSADYNLTLDADKLTIDGELDLIGSIGLKMLDGQTNGDLFVNGTLYNGMTSGSGNGMDFASGATWVMGSAGYYIKANSADDGSKLRNNYEGGIINIPATAYWIYRKDNSGTSNLGNFPSGASGYDMYYPNLTLENTVSGNNYSSSSPFGNPSLSNFTMYGNNGKIVVKGNFDVGGSGPGFISFLNLKNNEPVEVWGNTTIRNGSSLSNIGVPSGLGFDLRKDLTVDGTLTIVDGDSGIVKLAGTSGMQYVYGNGTINIYDLTTNNSSGITLQRDVAVSNQLTLTAGIVTTAATPTGLLTLGTAALPVAGNPGTAAYINGPLAKQFAVGANTEFLYPLGKPLGYPTAYNPCYVVPTNITGATTTFTSEYFAGPNEAQGVMGGSVLGISNKEYWNINKSPSNTSTARVKLYYDNPGSANWIYYTGASVSPFYTNAVPPCWYCNVAVVHKEATTWNFTKTSNFSATDPEYKYYATDGWIYSKAIDNFSPFTLAYSYNMILPVKLLAFTGRLINTDGLLEWSIADARDLDGFELEYSTDGSSYQSLAKIGSNGSTRFSFLHKKLPAGTNYYRLLVKEKGGNQYYSQVVMLNMGKLKTYVIGLAPTVVGTQLTTAIFAANAQKLQARINDVLGRQLWTGSKNLAAGTNQWNIDTHDLPKGLYFISLETPDGLKETLRFIKE